MTHPPEGPDPRKHLNATVVDGEPRTLMVSNDSRRILHTVHLAPNGFYQDRKGGYVKIANVGAVKRPTEWTTVELDAPEGSA